MAGRPLRRAALRAQSIARSVRRRNPGAKIAVTAGTEPGIVELTVDGKSIWSSDEPAGGDVFVAGKQRWESKPKKKSKWPKSKGPKKGGFTGSTSGQTFGAEATHSILKKLSPGTVVLLEYADGKKGYFTAGKGSLRQVTLKGFRPITTLGKLGKQVVKGTILAQGPGAHISFEAAKAIVEAHRGKKFSSTTSSSGAFPWASDPGGPPSPPSGAYNYGPGSFGPGSFGPGSFLDEPDFDPHAPGYGSQGPSKKWAPAYSTGGVLIRADGKTLLRQPMNYYDKYAWTFAKGRVDQGETDEEAALREVLEETGWVGKIVAPIPGEFMGGTTKNVYFLMEPVSEDMTPASPTGKQGPIPGRMYPHYETNLMRWVTQDRAREMINETQNVKGRERDLAVLDAAYLVWHGLPKTNPRRRRRNPYGDYQ
jgi:8-oxo-dGTP pyrophosphatase MutT (NUDIX family)